MKTHPSKGTKPEAGPEHYNQAYFLGDCGGYPEYETSRGEVLEERHGLLLGLASLKDGMRVLDLGFGRGEICLHAARKGAFVVGVDFSEAGGRIARKTLSRPRGGAAFLVLADARALPFKGCVFDRALMSDLIEHLHPESEQKAIGEIARVLRPEGGLVLHTRPNLWFYRYAWPLKRLAGLLRGKRLPRNPRSPYEKKMHINEKSPLSLKRSLGKFFLSEVLSSTRPLLSRSLPHRLIFSPDLWALASKRRNALRALWPSRSYPSAHVIMGSDEIFALGPIWHGAEYWPPMLRWTGKRASIRFQAGRVFSHISLLVAARNPDLERRPLRLRAARGGKKLGEVLISDPAWREVRFNLPEAARSDTIRVTLEVDRTWNPARDLGTGDSRELGIAVSEIRLAM